jgi:hypothetical protein
VLFRSVRNIILSAALPTLRTTDQGKEIVDKYVDFTECSDFEYKRRTTLNKSTSGQKYAEVKSFVTDDTMLSRDLAISMYLEGRVKEEVMQMYQEHTKSISLSFVKRKMLHEKQSRA